MKTHILPIFTETQKRNAMDASPGSIVAAECFGAHSRYCAKLIGSGLGLLPRICIFDADKADRHGYPAQVARLPMDATHWRP